MTRIVSVWNSSCGGRRHWPFLRAARPHTFLFRKVMGRFERHDEFESFENSEEQFACAADAVVRPLCSHAFATSGQTRDWKPPAPACLLPGLPSLQSPRFATCAAQCVPSNQRPPRRARAVRNRRDPTALSPSRGITEAQVLPWLPEFPLQNWAPVAYLSNLLTMHCYWLPAPACVTFLLPQWGFLYLPSKYLQVGLYPRVCL